MSQKLLNSFVILSCILALTHAEMIYRRYEKKHPRKKYVQIVEIFQTNRRPPHYSENERALNDFLGREAFRTDMNCTEDKNSATEDSLTTTIKPDIKTTTKRVISTTKHSPSTTTTTIFHLSTDPMMTYSPLPFPKFTTPTPVFPTPSRTTTTMKPPNLDQLFTIRSTKPTFKPNPKENVNPDYTALDDSWSPSSRKPFESKTNTPPTIPHAESNKERKNSLDSERVAGKTSTSTTTTERTRQNENDEYSDNEGEEIGDYDENNYEVIDSEEFDAEAPFYSDVEDEEEENYETLKRSKISHVKRTRLSRKRHTQRIKLSA